MKANAKPGITKQELSQLRYLNKEIELLKRQIADVEYAVETYIAPDVVVGSNPVWPYQARRFVVEGIAIPEYKAQIKKLRRKLHRRLNELMEKREEMEEYIASIPDSVIRMILTLRYVNGLSWGQVAAHIGGGNTVDSVRKLSARFVDKV